MSFLQKLVQFLEKKWELENLQSLCFSSVKRNFVTTAILHFFYSIIDTGVPDLEKSSITCLLLKISTFTFF
jgi:hypothetical protein